MAKAWKISNFNPERGLDVCLPRVLNIRFNEMLSNEKGTIKGEDIEYLHDMRVSSRRVQAILKAFRDYYQNNKFKKEYSKLRTIIKSLGIVRHYDVFIDMLEKYLDSEKDINKDVLLLFIIRQKAIRKQKRKELIELLKSLDRANFNNEFKNFLSLPAAGRR